MRFFELFPVLAILALDTPELLTLREFAWGLGIDGHFCSNSVCCGNWLSTEEPCGVWAGVTCEDGHLAGVNITDCGFGGVVPLLDNWALIKHLDLKGNDVILHTRNILALRHLETFTLGPAFDFDYEVRGSVEVFATISSKMTHLDFEGTNEITGTIGDIGPQLTSLALRNLPSIVDFQFIPRQLKSLTLDNVNIASPLEKISHQIGGYARLTSLSLRNIASREDVSLLNEIPSLNTVELEGLDITGSLNLSLYESVSLASVDFLEDSFITSLGGKLKSLNLTSCGPSTPTTLPPSFRQLTSLILGDSDYGIDLTHFNHTSLPMQSLSLFNVPIFGGTFDHLPSLHNLTNLQISRMEELTGALASISQLTNLQKLALSELGVSGGLYDILSLTNLRHLHIGLSPFNGHIHDLIDFKNLTSFWIRNTELNGQLENLLLFDQLETLGIVNNQNIIGKLESVRAMVNLRSLTLHRTSQIEGSIDAMSNLTSLLNLQLGYNDKITGNLSSLCDLSFQNLKIFSTSVSGDIPDCFTKGRFHRIVLDSNDIRGSMPALSAEYFSATWNYISCPLPDSAQVSNALLLPGNLIEPPLPQWTESDVAQVFVLDREAQIWAWCAIMIASFSVIMSVIYPVVIGPFKSYNTFLRMLSYCSNFLTITSVTGASMGVYYFFSDHVYECLPTRFKYISVFITDQDNAVHAQIYFLSAILLSFEAFFIWKLKKMITTKYPVLITNKSFGRKSLSVAFGMFCLSLLNVPTVLIACWYSLPNNNVFTVPDDWQIELRRLLPIWFLMVNHFFIPSIVTRFLMDASPQSKRIIAIIRFLCVIIIPSFCIIIFDYECLRMSIVSFWNPCLQDSSYFDIHVQDYSPILDDNIMRRITKENLVCSHGHVSGRCWKRVMGFMAPMLSNKLIYYILGSPFVVIGWWRTQIWMYGSASVDLLFSCAIHWFQTMLLLGIFVPILLPLTAFALITQGILLSFGIHRYGVTCFNDFAWPTETLFVCFGSQVVVLFLFAYLKIGFNFLPVAITISLTVVVLMGLTALNSNYKVLKRERKESDNEDRLLPSGSIRRFPGQLFIKDVSNSKVGSAIASSHQTASSGDSSHKSMPQLPYEAPLLPDSNDSSGTQDLNEPT